MSHGAIGQVSGLDHYPLDQLQSNWERFEFPYCLPHFRRRRLSQPMKVFTLDYAQRFTAESESAQQPLLSRIGVSTAGRCDCIALYIDYEMNSGGKVVSTAESCFSSTSSLHFLPMPRHLRPGDAIECSIGLAYGDSSFKATFS